jgi:pyruvate dehydrogenase E2 component (dihydrolipoamide acetyltransferase)
MARWEFKLPDIGEGVVEGEIVKWLVQPGDQIVEDQPLLEVMTDKATVVIPSPRRGKVVETVGKEGEIAKVHSTLVVLDVEGGATAEPKAAAPRPPTAQEAPSIPARGAGEPAPLSTAPGPAQNRAVMAAAPAPRGGNGEQRDRVLATPVTRRMAKEMGVDLGALQGSGALGRVMKSDVLAYMEQHKQPVPQGRAPAPQARAPAPQRTPPSGGEQRIPIRGLRKRIAESMVRSKFTAPHFTFVEECDTKALTSLRARLNERLAARGDAKVSYLPFIAKALVAAFRKYPDLNSNMDEARQELVVKNDVNLGIATATEQGLTVFVVKDVGNLSLREIGAEIDRMSKAAREQRLALHELQGGTFTITSLGKDGGLLATPIIHHPEVAILGVHRIQRVPVVTGEGRIEVGERMNLSCSFDHRVIDGHIGAAFLYEVIRSLEAPELLLADR